MNPYPYPTAPSQLLVDDEKYFAFPVKVLTVDTQRICVTVQDQKTGMTYMDVKLLPANSSSVEGTDVIMPEEGSSYLAVRVEYQGGFSSIALLTPIVSDAKKGMDAIATRPIEERIPGWNERKRGVFRHAYPGQHSVSMTNGYTEKRDAGWDRSAADLTRDKVDVHRHTRIQVTGRSVTHTDAGLEFSGPISRPNAQGLKPSTLVDGSQEYLVFLDPEAQREDRYVNGKPDVLPLVERLQRTQEFSVDFPIPLDVLESGILDDVLGTTADMWDRTSVVSSAGGCSTDDQTPIVQQAWDHPAPKKAGDPACGPTTNEGPTPRRRAYIIEETRGTLVGYNQFDKGTYGYVLKPTLFPYTASGRFGADVESSYLPVVHTPNHDETRLAASAFMLRFPNEFNTTRFDVSKEGMLSFEVGSTLPKEWNGGSGPYEHPHGAGRSLEGHLVGSMKLVVGKNRDEEDSIDLQALGQVVLRLGADDLSLPNERRNVKTQIRGKADATLDRTVQFWKAPKLKGLGDAGSLANKVSAENVSLRAAMDGGTIIRFGARTPKALRKHLINGYADGQGVTPTKGAARVDSKSSGRPTYPSGDQNYRFHDLTKAGAPKVGVLPYAWSGSSIQSMDAHGLSVDFHAVRDILIRAGANEESGNSILMDLAGGLTAWLGKDNKGRSVTASLDGGVELTIGQNAQQKSLRIEFNGDVDWLVKGNFHLNVTGDLVMESTNHLHVAKIKYMTKSQKHIAAALSRHTTEAPDIVHNQGDYTSGENDG